MKDLKILEGKKLLIVDDEPDILKTLRDLLDMCLMDTARTFEDAEALIDKNPYDLAIFDIMGGRELLEHVDDRLGHDMRYSVNSDKLKALGWSPQYNFESAILHTINWYKSNISWFGER